MNRNKIKMPEVDPRWTKEKVDLVKRTYSNDGIAKLMDIDEIPWDVYLELQTELYDREDRDYDKS